MFGDAEYSLQPKSHVIGQFKLAAAGFNRARTPDVPADCERAIQNLLGLQPIAAGPVITGPDPGQPEHVSAMPGAIVRRWGLHLPAGQERILAAIPAARTAQDIPIHGWDDFLMTFDGDGSLFL